METITKIIDTTLNSFDFVYCIIVNILTYILITITIDKSKSHKISTWTKRIILLGSIIFIGAVYIITGSSVRYILNSAILAPVFWSWVMKPVCKYFNIDYKDISNLK